MGAAAYVGPIDHDELHAAGPRIEDAPRPRGRQPIEDAGPRILDATLDELAARGYAGLRVDDVARRAGLAKTTIYRRWRGKDELVLAAIESLRQRLPMPDTGDIAKDLELVLAALLELSRDERLTGALGSLVAKGTHDRGLGQAMDERIKAPHRAMLRELLQRGVDRGQLRPDLDVTIVGDLLDAVAPYHGLISGEPVPPDTAHRVVQAVLDGARTRETTSNRSGRNRSPRRTQP